MPYTVPEDYKDDNDSFNIIIPSDILATPILITLVHFPTFTTSLIYTRPMCITYLRLIQHTSSNMVKNTISPYNNLDHLNQYNQ